MRHKHRTETLIDQNGNEVNIDSGISELISELWMLNIKTISCCENYQAKGDETWIWINFPIEDAKKFLNVLSAYDEDIYSMYNRIHRQRDKTGVCIFGKEGDYVEGTWEYWVQPRDQRFNELDEDRISQNIFKLITIDITFDVSVLFPSSDYEEVLRRVKKFNKRRRYL
ncbi:MAG: hypothetical protein SVW57_03205 [Thermodesulfobacteriota bacterium]|nr:hypothetical protein [Thermodesulfobacteriota bacterium]